MVVSTLFSPEQCSVNILQPHEMFKGQRIVAMAYGIAFVAGMNFFALLNFFPLMFSSVFEPDPVQIGLKGIPPAFSTTFGAVFVNAALTWFKGHNRELLLFATVLMSTSLPDFDDTVLTFSSCVRRISCLRYTRSAETCGGTGHFSWVRGRWCLGPCRDNCHYCHPRHDYCHCCRFVTCHSFYWWCDRIRNLLVSSSPVF